MNVVYTVNYTVSICQIYSEHLGTLAINIEDTVHTGDHLQIFSLHPVYIDNYTIEYVMNTENYRVIIW